jgi:hypothetical protein
MLGFFVLEIWPFVAKRTQPVAKLDQFSPTAKPRQMIAKPVPVAFVWCREVSGRKISI